MGPRPHLVATGVANLTSFCLWLGTLWVSATYGASPIFAWETEEVSAHEQRSFIVLNCFLKSYLSSFWCIICHNLVDAVLSLLCDHPFRQVKVQSVWGFVCQHLWNTWRLGLVGADASIIDCLPYSYISGIMKGWFLMLLTGSVQWLVRNCQDSTKTGIFFIKYFTTFQRQLDPSCKESHFLLVCCSRGWFFSLSNQTTSDRVLLCFIIVLMKGGAD